MLRAILLPAILAVAAVGFAAGPVTFDVASVKISKAPDEAVFFGPGTVDSANGRWRVPSVGGNVTLTNWTLGACIAAAWDLGSGQMSGPGWLNSERYDIVARTSAQTTQADLRIMLQALLAERFKLSTHRETKEAAIYALVLARNGPKLKPSNGDQRLPVVLAPPARLLGQGSTMQALALALRRPAGRTVVDQTGLNGTFDFTLTYSPETNVRSVDGGEGADAGTTGPSIFTALQEQLGLRLEPQKGQIEQLVVDHAEKIPTPN